MTIQFDEKNPYVAAAIATTTRLLTEAGYDVRPLMTTATYRRLEVWTRRSPSGLRCAFATVDVTHDGVVLLMTDLHGRAFEALRPIFAASLTMRFYKALTAAVAS